ncbi:AbrB/MazE/SpoVT family DNA-binding domain-containing protein [Paenibacillus medicaginis]|uniref:AbrB/MazE/SpoVT family DNA-binding domain-containing protein n=1 Tax=Paenibacillus medicaginis TaxID=1470560 RepID=A0ABV5C637_9BACL
MITGTIRKWGKDLALLLPSKLANHVNFKDGVEVELIVTENKEVILRPLYPASDDQAALRAHFLALRSLCKPRADKHKEMFDGPMGDELI